MAMVLTLFHNLVSQHKANSTLLYITNNLSTYFLIILDFIFSNDSIGMFWFLPGKLHASLQHSLFHYSTNL